MRKFAGMLLMIAISSLPVYSQTSEACRAAVQHLTLPPTVEFAEMHPGQPLTPIKFLFSIRGKEIYLATALVPPFPWIRMTDQPLTVLIVYQDEAERQEAIVLLRKMGSGGMLMKSSSPPLDNLKYSVVHCENPWSRFLLSGSCVIHDWIYYEPPACEAVAKASSPDEISTLARLNPRNRFDLMNNFNWLNGFVVPSGTRIPELKFPMEMIKKIGKK